MSNKAVGLIADSQSLLLDFDGPITQLMPSPANAAVAEQARHALTRAGGELAEHLTTTTDHLAVLRYAATRSPTVLAAVEHACTDGELRCAQTCHPAPGIERFMRAYAATGRPIIIYSNNAKQPIVVALDRFDIASVARHIVARPAHRPDLMKPDTRHLTDQLRATGASTEGAVFIGDSVSDLETARALDIPAMAYARNHRKAVELSAADACITDWATVTQVRCR